MECPSCGAEVMEIDVRCPECGHHLTSTGAHELLGRVVLGQYELTDILGQGGMSIVYKGRHKMTDQEVALKILPPELAAHSQVKSRFVEEARALAALDHPNIVHLYNFGQEGGSFVLAMQFVRGTTFERMILEAGELHWGLAAGVCIDVLRALEYAHSRGIIHRDMKPSNVLVREDDGSATVMDFGIAKMTTSTKLTATGQTMGTVRYMSPEQVRGKTVDERTDIYSLGATLYEALVGDTPFDGETHFEIMTKHLNEPPVPPSVRGVSLPGPMERAVMRALAKDPEDRFRNARDLRDALEQALTAGDMGEAETLRMTRDLVMRMPKEPTGAGPTPPAPAAGGDSEGVPDEISEGDRTDVVGGASRRRPILWIALAALVAVASAGVVVVMIAGGSSEAESGATPDPEPPASPQLPEPFRLAGVDYPVDRTYDADLLRVMSVESIDAAALRAYHRRGTERFEAFLRERGYTEPLGVQPITIQLVGPDDLCRAEIYRDDQRKEGCQERDGWYRFKEHTLLLSPRDTDLESTLAVNVARAICLQQDIALCDQKLLEDFENRFAADDE